MCTICWVREKRKKHIELVANYSLPNYFCPMFKVLFSLDACPHLNFVLSFVVILICIVPKLFGYYDSFNNPEVIYKSNNKSMTILATGIFVCSLPMLLDTLLDLLLSRLASSKYKKTISMTSLVTSISAILVSIDVLHKLGYIPYHVTPNWLHLSIDFLPDSFIKS